MSIIWTVIIGFIAGVFGTYRTYMRSIQRRSPRWWVPY
jgi:uncharacterized membrane protein YeaQ/YmgE (transglycosylase-associated protein family)